MNGEEEAIVSVTQSAKYKHIDPELIARLVKKEFGKSARVKDVTKAVKNKLHQIGGVFFESRPDYTALFKDIEKAAATHKDEILRCTLREAMTTHVSTEERAPFLENFYKEVLRNVTPPARVLDLACGLNPLARPWMGFPESTEFLACDIFRDLVGFLNSTFSACGWRGNAFVADLLGDTPLPESDVALLLKTIPCLEQVDKEAGARLLGRLNAPTIVVSFPGKSLGGREKGMKTNYAEHFRKIVEGTSREIRSIVIGEELIFILSS